MMRLVIDSWSGSAAGLKRYGGEGLFSAIGRKVFLSGLRKEIRSVESENRAQKIADVVLNGRCKEKIDKKKKLPRVPQAGVKRKAISEQSQEQHKPIKVRKYSKSTAENLINRVGGGIILD